MKYPTTRRDWPGKPLDREWSLWIDLVSAVVEVLSGLLEWLIAP